MQIACNQCSGDNYLCSGDTDTGAIEYCWANVTTCSIGKLTDRTNSQVVWGISCGVGEVDVDGTVCQPFQTQTADGYVCTCNTSLCNSIDKVSSAQCLLCPSANIAVHSDRDSKGMCRAK